MPLVRAAKMRLHAVYLSMLLLGLGGPIENMDAATVSPMEPPLAPVIVMGLPKTGTTSTAAALETLGIHTRHCCGNEYGAIKWPGCGGIANMGEHRYRFFYEQYGHAATWVLTERNLSAWLASNKRHLARLQNRSGSCHGSFNIFAGQGRGGPATVIQALEANVSTASLKRPVWGSCADTPGWNAAFYTEYYKQIRDFFREKGISYTVVNVDLNVNPWEQLGPIHGRCPAESVSHDFPQVNNASHVVGFRGTCGRNGPLNASSAKLVLPVAWNPCWSR
jgi:hypothetical protein